MQKKLSLKYLKNFKFLGLIFLTIFLIFITTFLNFQKNKNNEQYNNFINNIYLKKTLNEIINNLEPKYKKYNHKIQSGETFDGILENYKISKKEINKLKQSLLKKININNLNTNQKIYFIVDKTKNTITEFYFQISNT